MKPVLSYASTNSISLTELIFITGIGIMELIH